MCIKKSSINSMKKKVKRNIHLYNKGEINYDKYFCSMTNYYYSYRCNKKKVQNIIEHYI